MADGTANNGNLNYTGGKGASNIFIGAQKIHLFLVQNYALIYYTHSSQYHASLL